MTTRTKTRAPALKAEDRKAAIAALTMTSDKLASECKWIAEHSSAMDQRIHAAGVALIIASMPLSEGGHFDYSKAIPFIAALSPGQSRNRVVAWLHKFSNIRVTASVQEDKSMKFTAKLLKQADPDYVKAQPLIANNTPFWAAFNEGQAVDVTFTTMTFHQRIAGILRSAEKAKQAGKLDLTPKDMLALTALAKLDEELKGRAEQRKVEASAPTVAAKPKPTPARRPAAQKAADPLAQMAVTA